MARPFERNYLQLSPRQHEVYSSPARFRVLVAGRRFGKTHLAMVEMLMAAKTPGSVIWYLAPTKEQGKRIIWDRLKEFTRPYWKCRPNDQDKIIYLVWNSTITLISAFKPDSIRGSGLDFAVIDEAGIVNGQTWGEAIRPALSDRIGRALFIGTPKGCNHFYDTYQESLAKPEWAGFHFTTEQGGRIQPAELLSMANDMSPEAYRQEILAEFTNLGHHRVYEVFNKAEHVKPLFFDKMRDLVWAIDFNVNPMCMLLIQKIEDVVHVLHEIVIKPNANTFKACDAFLEQALILEKQVAFFQRPLIVKVYGDASGNQKRTSGAQTDWNIIKDFFAKWVGTFTPQYFINTVNPFVKDRVNCLNARLHSYAGDTRLFISPQCKELILDLERVTWTANNEIDKSDPARTHASDALGYFIAQAFPMKGLIGEKSSGRIV